MGPDQKILGSHRLPVRVDTGRTSTVSRVKTSSVTQVDGVSRGRTS